MTGNSASKICNVRAASSQLAVPFRTVSGLHLGRGGVEQRILGTPESESAPLNCPLKTVFSPVLNFLTKGLGVSCPFQ